MSAPVKHSAGQAEHVSEIEPAKTVRVDEDVFANMEKMVSNFDQVNEEAYHGTQHELEMTAWQAIRAYPKAAAYSFTLSLALVMEGRHCFTFAFWCLLTLFLSERLRYLTSGFLLRLSHVPGEIRPPAF